MIITPDWPAPSSVRSAITTRIGGVSLPPYDSFNIAVHVGDDAKVVQQNRQRLYGTLSLPVEPQWLEQVHGIDVIEAQDDDIVRTADGSYSHQVNRVCLVQTADCLPILLCNAEGTQIAAVHAGWRSLAGGIVAEAVATFSSSQLMAYLGPAISQASFEVGDDVYQAFKALSGKWGGEQKVESCFVRTDETHWHADLYTLARLALQAEGVQQIYGDKFCTYTDAEHFYSYRRNKVTGRMASLIWLTDIK